jgi:hypothetical protein
VAVDDSARPAYRAVDPPPTGVQSTLPVDNDVPAANVPPVRPFGVNGAEPYPGRL